MKTMIIKDIIFHADDYGANEEISGHILDCISKGALRSLSILPNSPKLSACMKLYEKRRYEFKDKKIHFNIHFNIAEGYPLSKKEDIPLLVNERGAFGISFFKLLLSSFTGKKKELQRQLINEYSLQLKAVLPYVDEIRIDSHQHYHMIPVVLSSILKVCEEEAGRSNKPITFIRVPAEPLWPFIKHPSVWLTVKPINIIKNFVLNFLNLVDKKMLREYNDRTALFFGILFSGRMDYTRVKRVLRDFIVLTSKKEMPLEVLAHPGGVRDPYDLMDVKNMDCVGFYTSTGRTEEKDMLKRIGGK